MSHLPIRILIADDHPVVRDGLRWRMSGDAQLLCVGEVENGLDLLPTIAATAPDILVLDLSMPHLDPIALLQELKRNHPTLRVLVLTAHDEEAFIIEMVAAGAHGYLLKNDKKNLVEALHRIAQGHGFFSDKAAAIYIQHTQTLEARHNPQRQLSELTEREREVLLMIRQGLTNAHIASALSISPNTVSNHINNIYGKLDLKTRQEAIDYARRHLAPQEPLNAGN